MMKIKFDESGNQVEETAEEGEKKAKTKGKNGAMTGFLLLLVILLAGGLGYVSYQWYQVNLKFKAVNDPKAQAEINKAETSDVIAKVSRHMILPTGEDPTLATIADAAALSKEQAFYTGSQNGDKVLIYMKAKKAIIYSPARDIIVNAGPVYVNDNGAQTPKVPAVAPAAKTTTTKTTP